MSAPQVSSPLSTSNKLALIKSIESRRPITPEPSPAPAPNPPQPFEVRIRSGIGDTTFVVGHDRLGAPMVELRVRRKHLTPSMVRRMELWCREHDEVELRAI